VYSAGQPVIGGNKKAKKSRLARSVFLEFMNEAGFSFDLNGPSIVNEKIPCNDEIEDIEHI
jgi:hypothetical protein